MGLDFHLNFCKIVSTPPITSYNKNIGRYKQQYAIYRDRSTGLREEVSINIPQQETIAWFRYQNTNEVARTGQIKTHRWLVKCIDFKIRNKLLSLDGHNGFSVRLTSIQGQDVF